MARALRTSVLCLAAVLAVVAGALWFCVRVWGEPQPFWTADMYCAEEVWGEAYNHNYSSAAQSGEIFLHLSPAESLSACEPAAAYNGEQPLDSLKRWQSLQGPPGSPEDRLKNFAAKLAAHLAIAIQQRDRGDPAYTKIVTGVRCGYLTWRPSASRGIIVMPNAAGLLVEIRRLPTDGKRWPSRSIYSSAPDWVWESVDYAGIQDHRKPLFSVAMFQVGGWKAVYANPLFSPPFFTEGHYVLIPYWLLLVVFGFAPVRVGLIWIRRRRRRRRGLCPNCAYDLRGSTERCPECGEPFDAGRKDMVDPEANPQRPAGQCGTVPGVR